MAVAVLARGVGVKHVMRMLDRGDVEAARCQPGDQLFRECRLAATRPARQPHDEPMALQRDAFIRQT